MPSIFCLLRKDGFRSLKQFRQVFDKKTTKKVTASDQKKGAVCCMGSAESECHCRPWMGLFRGCVCKPASPGDGRRSGAAKHRVKQLEKQLEELSEAGGTE